MRKAFAVQALSDLDARDDLAKTSAPACHQLHFLQMASEKVCKAFLIESDGYEKLKLRHDVIAKTLPVLARQIFASGVAIKRSHGRNAAIRQMAYEIELLCPSCDANKSRPDNSEYPWVDRKGDVQTPCLYSFSSLLDDGRTMMQVIQVIRRAANMYAE